MGNRSKLLILGALGLLVIAIVWRPRKPEPHSVILTWLAPPARRGVTVVGYNVYRRTGEGRSFVKVADKVSGSSYEDRMISSGRTYIYVVTSVDQAGRESRFSAETKAEVP